MNKSVVKFVTLLAIIFIPLLTFSQCELGTLPSVSFASKGAAISKDAKAILATVSAKLNANPMCKLKVTGYGQSSKATTQLSWDRVNAVIRYLTEKLGLSENRCIFVYAQDGDARLVSLLGTDEDGPSAAPAPHPNLRKLQGR